MLAGCRCHGESGLFPCCLLWTGARRERAHQPGPTAVPSAATGPQDPASACPDEREPGELGFLPGSGPGMGTVQLAGARWPV